MADAQEETVRKLVDRIAIEQGYIDPKLTIKPISSGGANFTTSLFFVTLSSPSKPVLKLFAKVATAGEKFRQDIPSDMYIVEEYVYKNLFKKFDEIQDKYNVPEEHRLLVPKYYGHDSTYMKETIVLQDLAAEGYISYDRKQPVTWEYASKTFEQLAKMQALSIVFQEDYPEDYEEAKQVFRVRPFKYGKEDEQSKLESQERILTTINEKYRGRVRNYMNRFAESDLTAEFFGPIKRSVLAHGDFKISNLMHKHLPNGETKVIIIDYQCVQEGSGVRDLINFLVSGTDEEFRQKHFDNVLDHYYKHMCESLRRMDRDPEIIFPRADFDYEVKHQLPHGLLLACYLLPIMTLETECAPEMDENLDIATMLSLKPNNLFEDRINGVVRDFERWGLL